MEATNVDSQLSPETVKIISMTPETVKRINSLFPIKRGILNKC